MNAPRSPSTPYESGSSRVATVSASGRLDSGYSAPERKKIGMTRKFMTSWNPCMSFSIEPMIVPSAAKTMAIRAMNSESEHHPADAVRAEPGDQADGQHERPLNQSRSSPRRASGRP